MSACEFNSGGRCVRHDHDNPPGVIDAINLHHAINCDPCRLVRLEFDSLRASNAALKQEVEALKKEKRDLESVNRCQQNDLMRFSNGLAAKAGRKAIADLENRVAAKEAEIRQGIGEWAACNSALADMTSQVASLQAKLSLYTSWQPSDPGTKEAMEAAAYTPCSHCATHIPLRVLGHTLRAAMVRLEEAEKLIAVLKKTPYTLSGPNGAETLAAWEVYNGKP